jgi:hypothetical protein
MGHDTGTASRRWLGPPSATSSRRAGRSLPRRQPTTAVRCSRRGRLEPAESAGRRIQRTREPVATAVEAMVPVRVDDLPTRFATVAVELGFRPGHRVRQQSETGVVGVVPAMELSVRFDATVGDDRHHVTSVTRLLPSRHDEDRSARDDHHNYDDERGPSGHTVRVRLTALILRALRNRNGSWARRESDGKHSWRAQIPKRFLTVQCGAHGLEVSTWAR